jgi:hypothetical protein
MPRNTWTARTGSGPNPTTFRATGNNGPTLTTRSNVNPQWSRNAGTNTQTQTLAARNNMVRGTLANQQWMANRWNAQARVNGQRFGLAGAASRPVGTLNNRFFARQAFAQTTFHGRFANWSWRHHHHRFRPFFPLAVIGWLGPLYWPYAYYDFVDYTFYPHAYDTFWPYAYDDVYVGMFGRYAYTPNRGAPSAPGRPAVATSLCSGESSGLTNWPIEQIAQTVEPNEAQRALLEGLRGATAQALDILKAACPTDLPSTPTGRLEGMRRRLEVMLAAVRTVRPALEAFYQSLGDEQKARFNALGPDENTEAQQAQRDLAQMCSDRASGVASLPIARIESTVRPSGPQLAALAELREAVDGAVNLLKSDCPTYRALSAAGRVEAMEQRLDAMLRAVNVVQPALDKFYGSLNNEQKERFNRLAPAQS